MRARATSRLTSLLLGILTGLPGTGHGQSPENKDAPPQTNTVTIPIKFTRGSVMVPLRINGSEPLSFMLDTGFGITMVHPDLAESLALRPAGGLTITGIAGRERATTYRGAVFELGPARFEPRRVASLPSDGRGRRRRDGILGAGFFQRFVVEMDLQERVLRLHEPGSYSYPGTGEVLPLDFARDVPVVEASVVVGEREPVKGRFEIDTGCDGALCLGRDYIATHRLLEDSGDTDGGVKIGVGGSARVREGPVGQLHFGSLRVEKPIATFFLDGTPADEGNAGHIGIDALKHFRVIFDYPRKRMILEPVKQPPGG